jgi:hypothetical protein
MARLDYFYDGQIRAYLQQVAVAFSGFQYATYDSSGTQILREVPVRWGNPSRMVANILRNGSENTLLSAPMITIFLAGISLAPERRQNPAHVEHLSVSERKFDEEAQAYTTEQGNKYSVNRHMAVPYNLTVQVDIWTTNEDQKMQLFEQIAVIYNPTVDFQSNVNPVDWSALSYIEMREIQYSSRSVPIGTDNSIDIMTLTMYVPIWINPPAKVRKQSVIHQIITNVIQDHECFNIGTGNKYLDEDLLARIITTPGNHQIRVEGNKITLLTCGGNEHDDEGDLLDWKPLLMKYGVRFDDSMPGQCVRPGFSELRLKRYAENIEDYAHDVVGTFELHPTEPNKLIWTIDPLTLPANTLGAISAIIDPHKSFPGSGLPISATGQRYLITNEIGGEDGPGGTPSGITVAWGHLVAQENDIIEFNGSEWIRAFDSSATTTIEFVLNTFSNKQLVWQHNQWTLAIDGEYMPGYWRLFI